AACRDARRNLRDLGQVTVRADPVQRALKDMSPPTDAVLLDPPRTGARGPVVRGVSALRPARVVYVACDPAALARDVARFATEGYRLTRLRAFHLFPMTRHVECVALFERGDPHQ